MCDFPFHSFQILAYNPFQVNTERYTCSSYGLLTGNEAYSMAALSFFTVPVIVLHFLLAFAANLDSCKFLYAANILKSEVLSFSTGVCVRLISLNTS